MNLLKRLWEWNPTFKDKWDAAEAEKALRLAKLDGVRPGQIIPIPCTPKEKTDIVWHSYEWERPQQDLPVIIQTEAGERVVLPQDIDYYFNVYGLKWRPTGIFTELGGTITQCGVQQANMLGQGCSAMLNSLYGSAALGAGTMNAILEAQYRSSRWPQ